MTAYVLIEVVAGKVKEAVGAIEKIDGVECAQAVVGPFDIIAYVKAEDMRVLGELVVSKIHAVEGVQRTMTCIAVEF
jgi:DNA-binding Lrp family transcriptional regulator